MGLSVAGKRADPLIQGTAMLDALPEAGAFALLDGVHEAGATTFDLAQQYGGGVNEARFGAWMRARRLADVPFLITKGGHPAPDGRRRLTPDDVRADLEGSLARLGVDAVDLYLLHRDDEAVPVGEVVDLLEALRDEGLLRAYGGSNWRAERIEAAQAYARAHGRAGMAATSPHYALAAPAEPPWPGCVSVAGEEGAAARAYYARTGLPVLAWSSLAMGWFALGDGTVADGREQTLGERVFDTAENRARRERARALAAETGEDATVIAFRFVLAGPMTVHPIVGCRTPGEYAALREAATRPLDAERARWLVQGTEAPRGA